MKIYTGGTFDVPHLGHMKFLQLCREFFPDSELFVALNTDEFIQRFKGKSPLFTYEERESYLKLTGLVTAIIPNVGEEDSKTTILMVNPNVVAIGMDWLERDYCKQMSFNGEWLTAHNIALCYIPRPGGLSSALIKDRLRDAE